MSHTGALTLLRTAEATGLASALSTSLAYWRKPLAQFDPGKIVLDLATALAFGGDCFADIATGRERSAVFGKVRAHSEKESAAPLLTNEDSRYHPLLAFVDHGGDGTGEPVAASSSGPTMPILALPTTTSMWAEKLSRSCRH
ncbi:hypothetical protein BJI47_20795 [Rhodococcus sp. 1168]|nr:hypothetical protein BJI47_20795 [Rhodococcus sp. 1168]